MVYHPANRGSCNLNRIQQKIAWTDLSRQATYQKASFDCYAKRGFYRTEVYLTGSSVWATCEHDRAESHRRQARIKDRRGCRTGPRCCVGDRAGRLARPSRRFQLSVFQSLACGEGGALTTNDELVFERAYSMHNAGRSRAGSGRWEHIRDVACLEPLALHAGVRAHGMHMFAMRYRQEHCGGLPREQIAFNPAPCALRWSVA
jgi:DegT/DnrJ/EryC1/StrS aminotransferase family